MEKKNCINVRRKLAEIVIEISRVLCLFFIQMESCIREFQKKILHFIYAWVNKYIKVINYAKFTFIFPYHYQIFLKN